MIKTTRKSLWALTFSAALCASLSANAETIEVQKLKHVGPFPVEGTEKVPSWVMLV